MEGDISPLSCPSLAVRGGERDPNAAPLRTAPPAPAAAEADREDDEEPKARSGLLDARLTPPADRNGSNGPPRSGDTVVSVSIGWGLGVWLPVSLPRNIGFVVLNAPWRGVGE